MTAACMCRGSARRRTAEPAIMRDGICAEGAMLVAGLPEATNSSGIGIYISQDIFDSKIIEDGWIFGEDADGSCYVAIKPSKGEFQSFEERVGGSLARVSISYVPVVNRSRKGRITQALMRLQRLCRRAALSGRGMCLCIPR